MSAKSELQGLIARHCQTVGQEVETVSRSVAEMLSKGSPEAAKASIEATHKIVGSSGSIGFPDVSAAAIALENALKALGPSPGGASRVQIAALLARLEKTSQAMSPERSTLSTLKI